jgi:hypothetical protein
MLTGVWLRHAPIDSCEGEGLAGRRRQPGAGLSVVALVSAEQEHVDQLLCPGGGGYSLALMTLAFWAVEQKGWRTGWTWIWLVFGSKRLRPTCSASCCRGAAERPFMSGGKRTDVIAFVFDHVFARIPDPGWAAFAYSVSFTAVCFVPIWVLFRSGFS